MLNIIKDLQGDTLQIRLVGTVDERSNIGDLIGQAPKKLVIDCKEIVRINSHGVRVWVKYFQELVTNQHVLKFTNCSPVVVQQMNIIGNFIPTIADIESVCSPYFCASCKNQFISVFRTADLKKIGFKVPNTKCPKCAVGTAVFDDIESEYFACLQRRA